MIALLSRGSFKLGTCSLADSKLRQSLVSGRRRSGAELCVWGCSLLPRRSPGLVPFALPLAALFLQQCHFLRQAGHTEKAVSLFQAMVDFTFFKPDSVKGLPTKGQVRVLPESPAPVSARPSSGEGCG